MTVQTSARAEAVGDGGENVDVAIIGGGPTGLFAGLLLHRLGVSVRVLDAKPCSLELGRADALNARTQQYFEVADLLDEILPQGLKCNTSSTFCDGSFTSRQSHWWTSLEHAVHKNFLMIGQPVIEEMLSRELASRVSYGETVATAVEDASGVSITTDKGNTFRSKYVIGADGARSSTRSIMGVTFTGTKPEMVWAVLDTFIETDFPVCPEIITFQLDGQSRVAWIPRERGLSRFYVLLDGEVTQARAEESIQQHMAPHWVKFKQTEWYSTFEVKESVASSFISKNRRIFLGGDAAHIHSVNGGQGLNTGISDAFALAWRLSMALGVRHDCEFTENLLDSYDIERRSTATGVVKVAHALVRDTMNEAKEYVATIERQAAYITGMGITYQNLSSPLVTESERGPWKAGHRCPDMALTDAEGKQTQLYTASSYGKFLVLSLGFSIGQVPQLDQVAEVWDVMPSGTEQGARSDIARRWFTAEWLVQAETGVVVVRPDMYVGAVCESEDDVKQWFRGLGVGS